MLKWLPRRLGDLRDGVEVADLGDGGTRAFARLVVEAQQVLGLVVDRAVQLPVGIRVPVGRRPHVADLVACDPAVEPDVLGPGEVLDQPADRQRRRPEAHGQLVACQALRLASHHCPVEVEEAGQQVELVGSRRVLGVDAPPARRQSRGSTVVEQHVEQRRRRCRDRRASVGVVERDEIATEGIGHARRPPCTTARRRGNPTRRGRRHSCRPTHRGGRTPRNRGRGRPHRGPGTATSPRTLRRVEAR